MGIESLNTAAWAAGFAMASGDDPAEPVKSSAKTAPVSWQAGEAVLRPTTFDAPAKSSVSPTEWVKGMLSLGRRATA